MFEPLDFLQVITLLIIKSDFLIGFLLNNIIIILLEVLIVRNLLRRIPKEDRYINIVIPIECGLYCIGLMLGIIVDFDGREFGVKTMEVHFF